MRQELAMLKTNTHLMIGYGNESNTEPNSPGKTISDTVYSNDINGHLR